MKTKPFNLDECMTKYNGRCVTNAGEAVEILKTDINGSDSDYPVLALVTDKDGVQDPVMYTSEGKYTVGCNADSPRSLRVPVITVGLFLVIVRDKLGEIYHGPSEIHETLQDAEKAREDLLLSITPGLTVTIHRVEIEI